MNSFGRGRIEISIEKECSKKKWPEGDFDGGKK
jgi:hypothetical protein